RRSPKTLDLAAPLLVQLNALLQRRELPALLTSARPAVSSLRALERPLTELLAKVTPVSTCVRDHATPVLKSKVDDGQHSTGLPVYKELLDGFVGVASASPNFDGNGPSVRYHGAHRERPRTLRPATRASTASSSSRPAGCPAATGCSARAPRRCWARARGRRPSGRRSGPTCRAPRRTCRSSRPRRRRPPRRRGAWARRPRPA